MSDFGASEPHGRSQQDQVKGRKILACLGKLARQPLSKRARRIGSVLAGTLFLLAAISSIQAVGGLDLELGWLLVAACMTPVVQLANAVEYRLLARIMGREIAWRQSIEVTILASAANLLPLPGGTLVKLRELGAATGRYQATAVATGLIGVAWLGAALILAGFGLIVLGSVLYGAIFGLVGCLAVCVSMVVISRFTPQRPALPFSLIITEGILCTVVALRIAFVMRGIGLAPGFWATLVIAAAGPISAIVGFFPGGLGLREIVAAALAMLTSTAPAVGTAGVAVDRFISMSVLAVLAGALSGARRNASAT